MTRAYVRASPSDSPSGHVDFVLDLFGEGDSRSTVDLARGFFAADSEVPVAVSELFTLASAIYCLDKVAARRTSTDAWTRTFAIEFPGSMDGWKSPHLKTAMNFLTGDHWSFSPQARSGILVSHNIQPTPDVVCLFSGGLDSLVGAIELLEAGRVVRLVAHHETGVAPRRQRVLADALRQHYGANRVALSQMFLRPAPRRSEQQTPLPSANETSTRARSLLFIASGLTVAAAIGSHVPVVIPENGFIGLNVPLSTSRLGSLSTRTTHPYFLAELQSVLAGLSIRNALLNPYRLMTKGEMLRKVQSVGHAHELALLSISCAHPEAARWRKRPQGNCGYCYPCLIRRASMHEAGWDSSGDYAWDAMNDRTLLDGESQSGADLRALLHSLARSEGPSDHLRGGPVKPEDSAAVRALYLRGRSELRTWVRDVGTTELANWVDDR